MKTIDIKGKPYIEVNERIKHYWENYKEGAILTEMISNENGVCIFKAEVYKSDKLIATGHAYEKENSTFINKTSYIENCETSAVGRALGIAGIGIDTSIASAEEVSNAIANQNKKPEKFSQERIANVLKSQDHKAVKRIIDSYDNGNLTMHPDSYEEIVKHHEMLMNRELNNGKDLL